MRPVALLSAAACVALAGAQIRVRDVVYLKQGGCAFTLDVFRPAKPNHVAIAWIVSSGWASNHEAINEGVAQTFNAKGYTMIQVVHGTQPKYSIREIVPQVRRAIRFIRAHAAAYDVSPDAIGVIGASAGGHLSLEIGGLGDDGNPTSSDPVERTSSRANAVVAYMPPTDFSNWGAAGKLPYDVPALAVLLPAFGVSATTPLTERKAIAKELSPIELVKPGFPPTLLIHGDADTLVPVQQSRSLDAAFANAHVEHKYVEIRESGHDWVTYTKGLPSVFDWFEKQLFPKVRK
ncbi:MAG: alpha/beta hydrolase [Fimbriimonas sp.]|nr:alpha/beta hydrolase [Fimbriimonas sp.]